MKRLLFLLLFIPIIGFSQYTAIPDQNFEQALIDLGHDDVIDGQVLTTNISDVDSLLIEGYSIIDLTGIEDFTDLTILYCGRNQLTNLDVSSCIALTYLSCYINQLTSLDVSGCTALTELYCWNNELASLDVGQNTALTHLVCGNLGGGNQLTNLDLSSCTALTYLSCSGNQLINLNISGCTALTDLNCVANQLTSLDVSGCTALTELWCSANQLTSLDVSNNTTLTELWCNANQLTNLDVSGCTALTRLVCSANQLTNLDVSSCTALTSLSCVNNQLTCLNLKNGYNYNLEIEVFNNPNLSCIEVDDPNWANYNWTTSNGSVDGGVTFATNCNYPADCNSTTNIKEYYLNLSIYPNPTNNLIQIEIEDYNGSFEAELYDFTGKLLETSNSTSLSLADYPSGIYLLKVASGDRLEQLKVVKE